MRQTMRHEEKNLEICSHSKIERDERPSTRDLLGMIVTPIDRFPAMKSGMDQVSGLIVMTVRLGSLADLAGVAAGDIVCEVDGSPVMEVRDLDKLMTEHDPRKPVRMLFRRVNSWRSLVFPQDDLVLAA